MCVLIKTGSRTRLSGRLSPRGAVSLQIDPALWSHLTVSPFSQCSTTGVNQAMMCSVLSMGWCTHTRCYVVMLCYIYYVMSYHIISYYIIYHIISYIISYHVMLYYIILYYIILYYIILYYIMLCYVMLYYIIIYYIILYHIILYYILCYRKSRL